MATTTGRATAAQPTAPGAGPPQQPSVQDRLRRAELIAVRHRRSRERLALLRRLHCG